MLAEASVGQIKSDSFEAFYRQNARRLVRDVRSTVGDSAEDVAQEALLVAYRRWDEVAMLDAPYAWVRRVAWRIANRLRQRDASRPNPTSTAGGDEDQALEPTLIHDAVQTLSTRQRTAISEHYLRDRMVGDVADAMSCSIGNAKVILHRARRALAPRLIGLEGRWVSTRRWHRDDVVDYFRRAGHGDHLDCILEHHLPGAGGRWMFIVRADRYLLERDDGLRLDIGTVQLGQISMELSPDLARGEVTLAMSIDGNQLRTRQLLNTTPPTDGVPDSIWMRLLLESSDFYWAGPST